ncbi:hypothetical protein GGR56DRAFT_623512 [Xylariaceae sp. FL0804]|nr:hypothetical protein GGR56DRAFT_623512 [Xylariaceae sp. FL0804]
MSVWTVGRERRWHWLVPLLVCGGGNGDGLVEKAVGGLLLLPRCCGLGRRRGGRRVVRDAGGWASRLAGTAIGEWIAAYKRIPHLLA